jgi:integrase
MKAMAPTEVGEVVAEVAAALEFRSKDGYPFDPLGAHWRLNKDVSFSLTLPENLCPRTRTGFISALARYAQEFCPITVATLLNYFRRYLRDTGASRVTTSGLTNWRAILTKTHESYLGSLKSFLIAWHDYGYDGVPDEVVELLQGWRIVGFEKGLAVSSGCPDLGPYTDLELGAILDWANTAVAKKEIDLEEFAFLFTLAMTARRTVQIAALRGKDLISDARTSPPTHRLKIPRAKQRGNKFRASFRSLVIPEDLSTVLALLHSRNVEAVSSAIGGPIEPSLADEIPVFANPRELRHITSLKQLAELLLGVMPDKLHATTAFLSDKLERCQNLCSARSERTGSRIRITATRFRYTRGTKLRREGFDAFIIAEALDHSDIQNVSVYTENTAQEAGVINALVGPRLAPFAQACMGRLVKSERDAIRGSDPRSRVPNDRGHAVGTCGSYAFCASGFRACYTCSYFQPWIDGPHDEVLSSLYVEKERVRAAGCADVVVNANDQLILAVEHCVAMCAEARSKSQDRGLLGGEGID